MQTDTVKTAIKKLTDTVEKTCIISNDNSQAKSAQYKWSE